MATVKRMLRYEVPVDDQWHEIEVSGASMSGWAQVLHVGVSRTPAIVDFWCIQYDDAAKITRRFRVFGTGQPVEGIYCGTAVVPGTSGPLVWHLFENTTG